MREKSTVLFHASVRSCTITLFECVSSLINPTGAATLKCVIISNHSSNSQQRYKNAPSVSLHEWLHFDKAGNTEIESQVSDSN